MSLKQFSLKNVGEIDNGKVIAVFDEHVKRVLRDCVDRPGDETARQVTLKLTVVPQASDGVCATTMMEFHVESKTPVMRTRPYQMLVNANGAALFNPESAGDVGQMTIDEAVQPAKARPAKPSAIKGDLSGLE